MSHWFKFRDCVVQKVAEAVKLVIEVTGEDKGGGYFSMLDQNTGQVVIGPTIIGEIRNGKGDKYAAYSLEKANRLAVAYDLLDILSGQGHQHRIEVFASSSWGTRDESKERWGGAILAKADSLPPYGATVILSFSGLSERSDEAAMLLAAVNLELITVERAKEIAALSNNEIFLQVFNLNT